MKFFITTQFMLKMLVFDFEIANLNRQICYFGPSSVKKT